MYVDQPTPPLPPDGLSLPELARRTGVPYHQLNNWANAGHLPPIGRHRVGTWSRRTFPESAVDLACLLSRLVAAGLTLDAAARVARGEHLLAPGVRVTVRVTALPKPRRRRAPQPRTKPDRRAPQPRTDADRAENAAIRAWARAQGIPVQDRGRLPRDLRAKYAAAAHGRTGEPVRPTR